MGLTRAVRVSPGRFAEISELSGRNQAELVLMYREDLKTGRTTLYYVEEGVFRVANSRT